MSLSAVKSLTMRQELRRYMLSWAALATLAFSVAMVLHYFAGVNNGYYTSIMMELRAYEKAYMQDPEAPLPQYYTAWFYLDNANGAADYYQQHLPLARMSKGEFIEQEIDQPDADEGTDGEYNRLVSAYHHELPDGRSLYVISDIDASLFTEDDVDVVDLEISVMLFLGISYLAVTLLVIWFYNLRTSKKINNLATWAEQLDLFNLAHPRPYFRYVELEIIADQLHTSLQRQAESLHREHQFLRHSSHEFRTPIAVIAANLELLNKLPMQDNQKAPMARLERANKGMQDTTETLLWLSREATEELVASEIDVAALLQRLTDELWYLLDNKLVDLSFMPYEGIQTVHRLPATATYIVFNNLIRNAFQYTAEGKVELQVTTHGVVVSNQETDTMTNTEHNFEDSYGMGLILVERICQRLGWQLDLQLNPRGMRAEIRFAYF